MNTAEICAQRLREMLGEDRSNSPENPAVSLSDPRFLAGLLGAEPSASGVSVSHESALRCVAVFSCIRIIAEAVGMVPPILYRRLQPRGKERATDHRVYKIIHDSPNPEMTPTTFREVMQGHAAGRGNAFAEIQRDGGGYPLALWPIPPERVTVIRAGGQKFYKVRLPDQSEAVIREMNMLHIPGFGYDGLVGYNPIQLARQAIGLAVATEEHGARLFSNGATPRGVLEHPGILGDDARHNLEQSLTQKHAGLSNAHRTLILEEGMKWHQTTIAPEEAQFLETRKFQVQEIARMWRVPPHMLADLDRATFSNIEHQGLEFVTYTLTPWLCRWEQEYRRKLLNLEDDRDYFVEHLLAALLRGDLKSRYEAYAIGRNWGWLSADDIREMENLNPLPEDQGGETYLVPVNMTTMERVLEPPAPPPAPNPQQSPPEPPSEPGEGEEDQKTGDNAKRASAFAIAVRGAWLDAAARVVRRECDVLLKAVRRGELGELAELHAAQAGYVERTFAPLVESFNRVMEAAGLSHRLDADQLRDAALSNFANLRTFDGEAKELEKVITTWQDVGPAFIADKATFGVSL